MAILWLPGRALLEALCRRDEHQPDPITSIGLSVAGSPLAALLLTLAGIPITRSLLVGAYVFCSMIILLGRLNRCPRRSKLAILWPKSHSQKAKLTLVMVFAITLILRFIQVRDLMLPAWVDSLHHTQIVQVIREQGRIPHHIMAYDPIPFYYHFGFHVLAAAFGMLADLPSAQAVLIIGQILNAVTVLSIYQLALSLTLRRSIGLIAALLTGFVSQMPAYYATWGRYTLLTGMVLLPITMATTVMIWRNPRQSWGGFQLALLTGGLILTHYLAAAYHLCFLLALVLLGLIGRRRLGWQNKIATLLAWSGLGVVIVSPWIIRIYSHVLPFLHVRTITNTVLFDSQALLNRLRYLWYLANRPRSWAILALALPAAITSVTHNRSIRPLIVWIATLATLSNELLCQILPFRADLLLICFFLPMNILAATGLLGLRAWVCRVTNRPLISSLALVLLLAAISVWGFVDTVSIINPIFVLATPADVKAMPWIEENIASNARFLINVLPWQYNLYRGTDGGWWIPLLSCRETILPPGVFYGFGSPSYGKQIIEIAEQVKSIDGCTPAFWRFVEEHDITHIYIGGKGGSLQPRWFDTCPGVWRVYMGYKVHIYEIRR